MGAFATAITNLRSKGLLEPLRDYISSGRPYFGICIGMQILFRDSLEADDLRATEAGESSTARADGTAATLADASNSKGLGIIDWEITRFAGADKSVPHMGWNDLVVTGSHPVLAGVATGDHAYFVHSWQFRVADAGHSLAHVDYGGDVTAIVGRDNVVATQFHPEKSQATGLRMIANFLEWKP